MKLILNQPIEQWCYTVWAPPYMANLLYSLGIDLTNIQDSLLQLSVITLRLQQKKQHIKIYICIRYMGWEYGILYHRKEILANKSWLT